MAKFRRNHAEQSGGTANMKWTIAWIVVIAFFIFLISEAPSLFDDLVTVNENEELDTRERDDYNADDIYFLPKGKNKNIVRHKYFALSYSEKHEVPEWVAYELTRTQLKKKRVRREDHFRPDPKVKTKSATTTDYRRSGYDRGHLVPAADRAFSREAMDETFYMSNIAPQERKFNGGIWRELEELTRDWAYKFKKLYVVTGPVLTKRSKARIGPNDVAVPHSFYKVLLDISEPELKAIAYILPNKKSDEPLQKYAVSIDEVEELTGIDFFADFMDAELEAELESSFDNRLWEYDEQKYAMRVDKWNNR